MQCFGNPTPLGSLLMVVIQTDACCPFLTEAVTLTRRQRNVDTFHPFWRKHFSESAGLWAAEIAKPFVLKMHAQQPTLTLISTTDLPTIPPIPRSSPPTYYQVPYPSDGPTSSRLCGGFPWNRRQQCAEEYTPVISPLSYTAHSCRARAPDAPSVEVLILAFLFYLLGNFHRLGTFLSLKSVLVELGLKKLGERRGLRFGDCLSLFT